MLSKIPQVPPYMSIRHCVTGLNNAIKKNKQTNLCASILLYLSEELATRHVEG